MPIYSLSLSLSLYIYIYIYRESNDETQKSEKCRHVLIF